MQLGRGIPRGCEAASHAMRHYIQDTCRHRNRDLLKVDMSTAFNSLRRDVLLKTSQREHPETYAFTLSAYGKPSWLFYGNEMILSSEGVQQGDHEGPLFFSDALMDFVEGVTSEINEWYLDDGKIADEAAIVLNDFQRLIVGLAKMGLQINSSILFLDNQEEHNREQILKKFRQVCTLIETTEIEDLVFLSSPPGKGNLEKTLTKRKEISNAYH